SGQILVSRDVVFREDVFPFKGGFKESEDVFGVQQSSCPPSNPPIPMIPTPVHTDTTCSNNDSTVSQEDFIMLDTGHSPVVETCALELPLAGPSGGGELPLRRS
ncbi:hypothetical protein HAX54_025478, partial [Datura stramonium]|nr:hypothetical protein [Datura stramonium]